MKISSIKVDDLELPMSMGSPFTYEGKHTVAELAGIDLDFRVRGPDRADEVEQHAIGGKADAKGQRRCHSLRSPRADGRDNSF